MESRDVEVLLADRLRLERQVFELQGQVVEGEKQRGDLVAMLKDANRAMNLGTYQQLARQTRLPTATPEYCLLNLCAEVGEVAGLVAKSIRDKTPQDAAFLRRLAAEAGDVLWHLAAVADDYDLSLADIAEQNLAKLADRAARGRIDGSGGER